MIKLIDSYYDRETGVASVSLATDEGNFEGHAFLHPEDKPYESEFIGCQIAELKALQDYYERKVARLKCQILGLQEALKVYVRKHREDEAEILKKVLNSKIKQKAIYMNDYEGIKHELKTISEAHNDFVDKMLKKRDNR